MTSAIVNALPASPSARYLLKFVIVAVLYAATAYLSLFLVPTGGSGASLVWPTAALGLAALVLGGIELWPAIFISFFIILITRNIAAPIAIGVAGANMIEAVVGAYLLSYFKFDTAIIRFRDIFELIVASLIATLCSATIIAETLHLVNGTPFNTALWEGLLIGHTVSLLSFAPFFITWGNGRPFIYEKWNIAEKVAVIGSIVVLNWLMFWAGYSQIASISLIYILLIPLIWTAVRLSMRGMSLALALTAIIAATGVLFGYGSFSDNLSQALFAIQILIGALSLIFLIFSSITEERRAAVNSLQDYIDRLEILLEQIRSSDEAKNEFMAILAHELRNPLAPIVSSVEIIKEGVLPASETVKVVGIIETHVRTLARLLDDMLDISRISQKKFHLHTELISLQSVVGITLETVETYMKARNHTLIVEMPKEPLFVNGDAIRLEQAFVNLLNNAAKYTEPGGKITFSAEAKGDNAIICISDTGVGIPEEMQSLIFEPFSTGSALRRPGGLGVGLYLTKRLVELHNGTIGVVSEGKNKGSTFILTIPLAKETSPAAVRIGDVLAQKPLAAMLSPLNASKTILIVDDNEPAAQGLSALLKHSGHTTHMAYTGASALKLAEEMKPSVVLLDIGLPDMEGYEVAKQLRGQRSEHFMLVALTGYGQENDKKRAWDAGFDHHLTKPVGIADVKKILAEI